MMRRFVEEKENPLLYASTYHAGDYLDPVPVAQAKARHKAKKLSVISHSDTDEGKDMAVLQIRSVTVHPKFPVKSR